ncbi:MAG: NUDIX hydrolase [Bdellovibrionales bacterium]|nr:NUDIX hydrolase [Bdellovibrionales bacterium]
MKDAKSMVSIWKVLETTSLFQGRTQSFRSEKVELPNGKVMPAYFIMDFPDWVHAIPLTPEGKVILVRQYRHATGEITFEFPGGTTHSQTEDPSLAALRELQEETGYTSEHIDRAGILSPNPAFQSNRIHTYVAFDCKEFGPQQLDPYEIIDVRLVTLGELEKMILEGHFSHALMVAGFYLALPLIRKHFPNF